MKERVYLWDNLKVVLMMLVVITHSVNVYQLDGSYWVAIFMGFHHDIHNAIVYDDFRILV